MPRPRSNSKEGKEKMWKSRNQFFLAQVQVAVILVIAHVSVHSRECFLREKTCFVSSSCSSCTSSLFFRLATHGPHLTIAMKITILVCLVLSMASWY
jgi:hypothetical protein